MNDFGVGLSPYLRRVKLIHG